LFADHRRETISCAPCGTVALDADAVADRVLQIHMAAAPARPQARRLSA